MVVHEVRVVFCVDFVGGQEGRQQREEEVGGLGDAGRAAVVVFEGMEGLR